MMCLSGRWKLVLRTSAAPIDDTMALSQHRKRTKDLVMFLPDDTSVMRNSTDVVLSVVQED